MNMGQPEENQFAGDGPVWDRIRLYVPWLALFWCIVYFVPIFRPIFAKLQEKGGLPPLAAFLVHFDQLNEAWYYLPTLVLAVVFVVFNEAVFGYLRRRGNGRLWSTHWSTAMLLALLLIVVAGVYTLNLPVTRMIA